jgi:ketosteroid isomerase-like protein
MNNGLMDRRAVEQWVDRYELCWRTPGTDQLVELFLPGATYLPSPWARPVCGLDEIAEFWESRRDGADEQFTLASNVLAVDGDTAVVRVLVEYADPEAGSWRDLWVLHFAADGRCSSFEEWPFSPTQPDGN